MNRPSADFFVRATLEVISDLNQTVHHPMSESEFTSIMVGTVESKLPGEPLNCTASTKRIECRASRFHRRSRLRKLQPER
jgi:hypothetical protein